MTVDEANAVLLDLARELDEHERVTLAWAVGNEDRVRDAWQVATGDIAMRVIARGLAPEEREAMWCRDIDRDPCFATDCGACANAIRRVVPEVTLQMVLERWVAT